MMIKGVIFDLDGVVIESELFGIRNEVQIFKRHGIPLTETVAAEYLGLKLDDYITALENRFGHRVDHTQVLKEFFEAIEKMYATEVPLVEDVAEVLPKLALTFKLALATSRETRLAKLVMTRLGVAQYFHNGIYKEDVTNGKPNPETFLKTAALINLKPVECAVIEDAERGFRAGASAGMYVVARKTDYNKHQDFSSADVIVENMRDIPRILQNL